MTTPDAAAGEAVPAGTPAVDPHRSPIGGWLAQVLAVLATAALVTLAFPLQFWSFEVPGWMQGYTAWVAFAPLILVAQGRSPRRVAFLFWFTSLLYFTGTIFWVVVAMTEYGHVPFAISLLALMLLSGFLALFHALGGYLAARAALRRGIAIAWPAALAFTGMEYLRNYVFTGFPWSNTAYSQARFIHLIQIADLSSVYGLTFLIVLMGGGLAGMVRYRMRGDRRGLAPFVAAVALFLGAYGYGMVRVPQVRAAYLAGDPVRVGLLQGNIPQDEKWLAEAAERILDTYAKQVELALAKGAELIVWPEAAIPYPMPVNAKEMIPRAFPETGPGVPHIIGVPVYYRPDPITGRVDMHNSAFMVGADRAIAGRYDKSHLVPFGEYVPLQSILSFLGPLVEAVGDFKQGEAVVPLSDGRHRYGVLICYEDIFPEIGRALGRGGMELLVNITNDAWYGPTSAPKQHLDMAVFRAIESRVPAARAANTGISAFIDPTGHVLEQTGLFVPAVVVREMRLMQSDSPYLVIGDAFAIACLAGMGLLAFWRRKTTPT